jgi:hypothetical protein
MTDKQSENVPATPPDDEQRLKELAEQINEAHSCYKKRAEKAAEYAIQAGHLLIKAKRMLKHGQYGNYIKDNFPFGERMALYYVNIAKSGEKSATIADLGLVFVANKGVVPNGYLLHSKAREARAFSKRLGDKVIREQIDSMREELTSPEQSPSSDDGRLDGLGALVAAINLLMEPTAAGDIANELKYIVQFYTHRVKPAHKRDCAAILQVIEALQSLIGRVGQLRRELNNVLPEEARLPMKVKQPSHPTSPASLKRRSIPLSLPPPAWVASEEASAASPG